MRKKGIATTMTLVLLISLFLVSCASQTARAVRSGNIEALEEYIAEGGDVNAPERGGKTFLMFAAEGGQIETSKLLLDNGALIDMQDNNGLTALMYGARKGHVQVLDFLIERGADKDIADTQGETALMYAADNDRFESLKTLVEAGADIDIVANNGYTAFLYTIRASAKRPEGFSPAADFLKSRGAKLDAKGDGAVDVFFSAISAGNGDVVAYLLDQGTPVEVSSRAGETPITQAGADTDMAALLIERGADPNKVNKGGQSPLIKAIQEGSAEAAQYYLALGNDVNRGDNSGNTPLMFAAASWNPDLVQTLLSYSADANIGNRAGKTALLFAVEKGDARTVELLIQAGAKADVKDSQGNGVVELVEGNPDKDAIVALLKNAGVVFPEPELKPEPVAEEELVLATTPKEGSEVPATGPILPNATGPERSLSVSWSSMNDWSLKRIEGFDTESVFLNKATLKVRYYREKDWFFDHIIPVDINESGIPQFRQQYKVPMKDDAFVEVQITFPTEGGKSVNVTEVKSVQNYVSVNFSSGDFRFTEIAEVDWPAPGTPVEVDFKYNVYAVSKDIQNQLRSAGDEIPMFKNNQDRDRAMMKVIIKDESGQLLAEKEGEFSVTGFLQSSITQPRRFTLSEGSKIQYRYEIPTKKGNLVYLEGTWPVQTVHSTETRFRTAAQAYIIPSGLEWKYEKK